MSKSAHPNCNTSDFENVSQTQQASSSNFSGNADKIVNQKTEQAVQTRLALPEVSNKQKFF